MVSSTSQTIDYIFLSPEWQLLVAFFFFFSSRRRHTRCSRDWSSDVCSSDLDYVASSPVLSRYREKCTIVPYGVDVEAFALRDGEEAAVRRRRESYGGRIVLFQIGRASCRERVWISVVAESLAYKKSREEDDV